MILCSTTGMAHLKDNKQDDDATAADDDDNNNKNNNSECPCHEGILKRKV